MIIHFPRDTNKLYFLADRIDFLIEDLKTHTGDCKCPDEDDCPNLRSNPYGGYQPAVAVVDKMTIRNPKCAFA